MLTQASGEKIDALVRSALSRCGEDERVAVGVSGGADSMALLWSLSRLAGPGRVLALTVDHGLRAGAAGEAQAVAQWCAAQGIDHQTLRWTGDKPGSGIQAAARAARYELMARACNGAGISTLFIAHHRDDRAETVFARLARGGRASSLACMTPERLIAAGAGTPVRLVRPLLAIRRAFLRQVAVEAGLPVAEDPSNDDPAYERVRRRAFLAAAGVQRFLDVEALAAVAAAAEQDVAAHEALLGQDFRAAGGWFHGSGAVFFARAGLEALPAPRRARLLARALEAVGGTRPGLCEMPDTVPEKPLTLAGALIEPTGRDIAVMREPAALLGRADGGVRPREMPFEAGEALLFDGRFVVFPPESPPERSPAKREGTRLAALGMPHAGPVTNARLAATMPALWRNGQLIAVPSYAKSLISSRAQPWNGTVGTLDIKALTEEKFYRRVLRFAQADPGAHD